VVNGHQEQPGFLDLADVTRGMSAREMLARAMDARSGMGVARWGFSLRCLARRHIGSPYASHPPDVVSVRFYCVSIRFPARDPGRYSAHSNFSTSEETPS
jgi:hypothetical protein